MIVLPGALTGRGHSKDPRTGLPPVPWRIEYDSIGSMEEEPGGPRKCPGSYEDGLS